MARDIQEPTIDSDGEEVHPAFGMVGVTRGSVGPPGATLFDSEIQHQHIITLRVSHASHKRHLGRDWIHGRNQIVEIEMSEAQWAAVVSSVGGSGVPCTLRSIESEQVPGFPHRPRLEHSVQEVRGAANKALRRVREAFAAYKEHKTVANLRDLEAAIEHFTANIDFTNRSLNEHVENVVTKARADIETMVARHAQLLGHDLDAAALSAPLEISAAPEEREER